jgi:hypothetical protein
MGPKPHAIQFGLPSCSGKDAQLSAYQHYTV